VNAVLAWVKKNWVIVVCGAVVLAALPTAWVFSGQWNQRIREDQKKKAQDLLSRVEKSRVTYAVAPPLPGAQPITATEPPNDVLTAFFKAQRDRLSKEAEAVVAQAERINKGSHGVLVEGLFPAPAEDVAQIKPMDMIDRLIGKSDQPSALAQLLSSVQAGEALGADQLAQALETVRSSIIEAQGAAGQNPTPEQAAEIKRRLVEARRQAYQRHARSYSVYASAALFPTAGGAASSSGGGSGEPAFRGMGRGRGGAAPAPQPDPSAGATPAAAVAVPIGFPSARPSQPPTLDECFAWQQNYWLLSDLFGAVRRANSNEAGRLTSLDESVVKRVERIILDGPPGHTGVHSEPEAPADPALAAAGAPMPTPPPTAPDLSKGLSGRYGSNSLYDVRRSELVVVVSAERLPKFLEAIARTNFMSVIDMDLREVDLAGDLAQGYYYGEESVVRAAITIESVWLRSWRERLMPASVRAVLGVPAPSASEAAPAAPGQS
jgi:hypothetical protein